MRLQLLLIILLLIPIVYATEPMMPTVTVVCTPGELFPPQLCNASQCTLRTIESGNEKGSITVPSPTRFGAGYELTYNPQYRIVKLMFSKDEISTSDGLKAADNFLAKACGEKVPIQILEQASTLKTSTGQTVYQSTITHNGPVEPAPANSLCTTETTQQVQDWMIVYESCTEPSNPSKSQLYVLVGAIVALLLVVSIVWYIRKRGKSQKSLS